MRFDRGSRQRKEGGKDWREEYKEEAAAAAAAFLTRKSTNK
jgi:hypothetical protein